jgi:anthranilate synthase component 2
MLEFAPHPTAPAERTVIVIDNYDSFTFNLVHALAICGARCVVVTNDELDVEQLLALECSGYVISPGPGRPEQAGVTPQLIAQLPEQRPLLGVCLGHQAIAQGFGAQVVQARRALHGKRSAIEHDGKGLFAGLETPLTQARYNSLTVAPESLPACLQVLATADGEVMALRHRERPIHGVQFHPESALSERGSHLLGNWVQSLPP